ncbi:MAG: 4a-hydroxytetrahydrobiopterin dehydratase [Ktedonobacteraceae bacterium]
MEQLNQARCIPCEGGVPPAADNEIASYVAQLPDWKIAEVLGIPRITRRFAFDNFVHALAFTNRVGELAEMEGHHPALLTEWGKVTVSWWTHAIGGLHKNDFIMAAKTDEAFRTAKGVK